MLSLIITDKAASYLGFDAIEIVHLRTYLSRPDISTNATIFEAMAICRVFLKNASYLKEIPFNDIMDEVDAGIYIENIDGAIQNTAQEEGEMDQDLIRVAKNKEYLT